MKVYGVAGYTSHVVYDSSLGEVKPVGLVQGSDAVDTATSSFYKWVGGAWVGVGGGAVRYDTLANFAAVAADLSTFGVTYECPVLDRFGFEVGRATWTCMKTSAAPAYGWRLGRSELTGTDDRRPTCASLGNGATFVGAEYYATDTSAVYACMVAGSWHVRSANDCGDMSKIAGLWDGDSYECFSRIGVGPVGGPGTTTVIAFQAPAAIPTVPELYFWNGVGGTRGEFCSSGGGGVNSCMYIMLKIAGSGWVQMPNASFAAILGEECCLAMTHVAGAPITTRYSFNGSAVAAVSHGAGAYIPPVAGDPIVIGNNSNPWWNMPVYDGGIKAIWTSSVALSDVELESISLTTTSRIPNNFGTISFNWASPRVPAGALTFMCSGQYFTNTQGVINAVTPFKLAY